MSHDNPSAGHVEYGDTRAELFADGTWRVTVAGADQPLPAEVLGEYYADKFRGPAYGRPGSAALADLARRKGGTAHFPPRPPAPPGTVY